MGVKQLTKTSVGEIPYTAGSVAIIYDTKLKGFGLRVSGSVKAFFAEGRVNGKTRRVKIGTHEKGLSAEEARKQAQALLAEMHRGEDPNAKKRNARLKEAVTLEYAFQNYLQARKDLKPKSAYDYRNVFRNCFDDWAGKAVSTIDKGMVERKHRTLGEIRGQAYANLSMRLLRAVFNFAKERYAGIGDNPVMVLSRTRAWYRVERRQTLIKPHELPAFFKALNEMADKDGADYLLLLLFTGLRREEAARLEWETVDMKARTFTIPDTKNRNPHTLPMSNYLYDLFKRREENRQNRQNSPYLFPQVDNPDKPLADPRNIIKRVERLSNLTFMAHDLRRTFASIAAGEVSAYDLKKLLNHKSGGDVTAGYIVKGPNELRPAMERITSRILALSEEGGGKVIPLNKTGVKGKRA